MNKTWRSQKVYNGTNNRRSVAELWWKAFNRVNNMSFRSSTSEAHQLEPFNYSLSIPSKSNLEKYDKEKAISSFLGDGSKIGLKDRDDLATIYHELFHVFQTNSTKKTLDYFYLVDNIQRIRTELLEYLGYANFFPLSESTNSDFGKTIFHCVENYEKLGKKESFSSMIEKELAERYKEIDADIEKFITQYGENYREKFEEQADIAKENFKETISQKIEENIPLVQEQSKDIKKYADLNRRDIESLIEVLIEFFKLDKDKEFHLFHLIEGSAQIFGWCCAGYNIDEKFALRKKELDESKSVQTDTYEKAYELFKEHGGTIPLLFIIISLFSLSNRNPIDVFIWCLKKIKIWEEKLTSLLDEEKITSDKFRLVILQLIEQIENSLKGNFYNANSKSIHDKEDDNSLFLKSINRIRRVVPKSNKLEFLSDLILDEDIILALIDSFESHSEEFKNELRKNEVMRDFEKFLYMDRQTDTWFRCCDTHDEVERIDNLSDWKTCIEHDGFNQILLNDFKVKIPNKLLK